MSPDPGRPFTVEPWIVREPSLDMESLGVTESVFALSNGHIGLRGNLDEGEPHATPGTYLNSFYERRPLPYAEGGYGYPESGQTIINVTNGKIIRLLVDDEPFDLRYGQRAPPPARAGPAVGHADPRGPLEQPGGQDRQGAQRAAGLADPARRRGDLLRGRGRGPGADRRPVRAGGQRAAAHSRTAATPASRPRCSTRWSPSSTAATTPARRWCTTPATPGCAWPRRWTTRSAAPRAPRSPPRPARTSAAPPSSAGWSPAPCCAWSSTWPTAGRRGGRCLPCTTRSGPGSRPPATPGGRGCAASSARSSTSSGPPRTSRSRATPSCSRPSASRSSTCCRRARGPSAGRSGPRA